MTGHVMGVVRKVFRYMWHTSIARLRLTLYKVDMVAWGTYAPKRLWFIVTWLRKLKTCKDVNIIYAVQDVGDQTPVSCICFFVCMVFCAANRLAVFPLWCCLLSGGFRVLRLEAWWVLKQPPPLRAFWIRCTSKIVQVTPIWLSPQALISGGG